MSVRCGRCRWYCLGPFKCLYAVIVAGVLAGAVQVSVRCDRCRWYCLGPFKCLCAVVVVGGTGWGRSSVCAL